MPQFDVYLRRKSCAASRLGLAIALIALTGLLAPASTTEAGTVVRFDTSLGLINVELTDGSTPLTVTNFLSYINDGSYTHSMIHRSVHLSGGAPYFGAPFVIQGGGFTNQFLKINPKAPVTNEFHAGTNVRGTIAMAKSAGSVNSATNQWFFNLRDNTDILDPQNGGFTSFGTVLGNGMDVVDAINSLPEGPFDDPQFGLPTGSPNFFDASDLPVRNYSLEDYQAFKQLGLDNIVEVFSVSVVPPWQNPLDRLDVTHDGTLSPFDVLMVINELNANGTHALNGPFGGNFYYDVDGNGSVSALDALLIINVLNDAGDAGFTALSFAPGSIAAVPEPSSLVLAAIAGLALLGFAKRRFRRA